MPGRFARLYTLDTPPPTSAIIGMLALASLLAGMAALSIATLSDRS